MGRAARLKGKTLEERIDFALRRKAEEQERIRLAAERRLEEEALAIQTMVWWQFEMSAERMEQLSRIRHRRAMKRAALHSILAGTLYSGIGAIHHGHFNR
jgi:hypothetical protein